MLLPELLLLFEMGSRCLLYKLRGYVAANGHNSLFPFPAGFLSGRKLHREYNIGYEDYNDEHGITTIPHPAFWEIAAHEGCTAIIGVDAHNNQYLETPFYYDRANGTLQKLGMKVTDRIPFLNEK